jgi:hypothetical protein
LPDNGIGCANHFLSELKTRKKLREKEEAKKKKEEEKASQ